MIINLDELNYKNVIEFNETLNDYDGTDKRIYGIKDLNIKGFIFENSNGDISINANISGQILIEDSISLDKVWYKIDTKIEENLEELQENYEGSYQNSQNTLDLKQILWQNIVLEVPISYTTVTNKNLKGNGWELGSGENKKEIDPRLQKLKDLLKGDD